MSSCVYRRQLRKSVENSFPADPVPAYPDTCAGFVCASGLRNDCTIWLSDHWPNRCRTIFVCNCTVGPVFLNLRSDFVCTTHEVDESSNTTNPSLVTSNICRVKSHTRSSSSHSFVSRIGELLSALLNHLTHLLLLTMIWRWVLWRMTTCQLMRSIPIVRLQPLNRDFQEWVTSGRTWIHIHALGEALVHGRKQARVCNRHRFPSGACSNYQVHTHYRQLFLTRLCCPSWSDSCARRGPG